MSDFTPQHRAPASSWGQSQGPIPSPNVQATMTQMTTQLQTVIDAAERAAEAIRFDAEEQARHHLAEAQRKADRLTAERVGLISDLTDDLIRHASTVRDHSEQMIRALEDAISSVTTKLEQPALTDSLGYAPANAIGGQTALADTPGAAPRPGVAADQAAAPAAPTRPMQAAPAAGATRFATSAGRAAAPATPAMTGRAPAPGAPAVAGQAPAAAATGRAAPVPAGASEVSEEALLHATRLAIAGNDRATIAAALRDGYGVADPEPVVARVFGEA